MNRFGGEKMSAHQYYEACQKYMGRAVVIRTNDGRVHQGIIREVDRRKVYLEPLGNSGGKLGGYGYGFWGPGFGFGFGSGILLGSIVGLSLLPFWWI